MPFPVSLECGPQCQGSAPHSKNNHLSPKCKHFMEISPFRQRPFQSCIPPPTSSQITQTPSLPRAPHRNRTSRESANLGGIKMLQNQPVSRLATAISILAL